MIVINIHDLFIIYLMIFYIMIDFVYLIVSKMFLYLDYYLTFYLRNLLLALFGIYRHFINLIMINLIYNLGDQNLNIF